MGSECKADARLDAGFPAHYAIDDYGDQRRVVRRVTIKGEAPVGIDGRHSRQIKPVTAPEVRAA